MLVAGGTEPHHSLQHIHILWSLLVHTALFLYVKKHVSDIVVSHQLSATCVPIYIALVYFYTALFPSNRLIDTGFDHS